MWSKSTMAERQEGHPRRFLFFCALSFCLSAFVVCTAAQGPSFDLVIRNGRIIDGSGSPWYRGDIAIQGDRIARIASSITESAARIIDARSEVVAPWFIDIPIHAREGIFDSPAAENYIRQGVTTVIEGPDGSSPLPIADFLAKLDALQKTINIGTMIGQGSVRAAVIGLADRKPTADELAKMRMLVDQGMKDGAFGLSTGLFYVPGTFTSTDEVIELAKVAARYGGIYISHMRDETSRVVDSVKETISIGEQGGLPTQLTHHKIVGTGNWGKSAETLRLVDEARKRGVDATIDQYPYTASSTSIGAALFPAWAQEGGRDKVVARLKDAAVRADVKGEVVRAIQNERGGGDPKNVVLARCTWNESLSGKSLAEVTRMRGMEVTIPNAAEAAIWIVEQGNCSGIFHAMTEEDLQRILRHPATMIASDGGTPIFGQASPHPRNYGTFARILAVYVRDLKVITLEDAVRKMSSLPAQRLGLTDRGLLRPGMKADIAVFDPARVRDVATFEKPHQYAEGFSTVVINGKIVLDAGSMSTARPGRVLYHGR